MSQVKGLGLGVAVDKRIPEEASQELTGDRTEPCVRRESEAREGLITQIGLVNIYCPGKI